MWKKIGIVLFVLLLIIQFIRPEKNNSGDDTFAITTKYSIPKDVQHILQVSCYDCHSNITEYPWYSNVQPAAWFLAEHVNDGKKHLNFSNFTKLPLFVQNHKLEETIEMVEEKEMPLPSYTYLGLHPEADLTNIQRQKIIDWANEQMNYLKQTYPADSLVFPKRK
ncbi:heme-binding domain-containing protein [Maribacter hydrothermalis]|uniref:Cytochrome C n=1 Tax=Maribacter hydrothermalis TaxID=1836467 RepID=A0A1B7YXP2_9FLAO|nr:heme-binding domain-containing protein [Maribacter hydrothermalis]APQ16833.1 cytochrome C [Maribacter hydrothermalis]OBR35261.1 cytochrome C [Maribacter hydrothermalis]